MASKNNELLKLRNVANIFLFFLCTGKQFVTAVSLLDEYLLEAGGLESDCGTDITGKQSIILLSQPGAGLFGGLTSYKSDQNCTITFEADAGKKIVLQFPFFDLQPPDVNDGTCFDKVFVTELGAGSTQTTDICTQQVFVSVTNKIEVKFMSDSSIQRKGFKALLTSFHDGVCTNSEFKCDTNRCISNDLKCDGNKQCVDDSDENKEKAGCTLLDEILNQITGLGKYGILAISAVLAVIFMTIFISIFLWKCVKSDNKCCKCSNRDDLESIDSASPPTTSRKSNLDNETTQKTKKGKMIKVKAVDDNVQW